MKILLSPAKTLDYKSPLPEHNSTQPLFVKQIKPIIAVLQHMSPSQISELMHVSDTIAQLNYQRFQDFNDQFTTQNSRPAVYAFAGDVYNGLDAYTIPPPQIDQMQSMVRILSGLYGYLRPLDLIQPYRLEMGTKLSVGPDTNLYKYWSTSITASLNNEIDDNEPVVNLASNEYFKVIDKKKLKGQLITPVFKDFKNDQFKVISFYAKKARGLMARYLIDNNACDLDAVLAFANDRYRYSPEHTTSVNDPVFIR